MLFLGLATSLAVAAVSAAPAAESRASTIALPLSKHVNVTSFSNIVGKGRARLDRINGLETAGVARAADASSGPVTNEDVSYTAAVVIGGATYDLIVDTGSSNTWCGANGACEPSATGRSTGGTVAVSYGSGSFSGTEYTDTVSFGGLTVAAQSVGAASQATGFTGVDGILGFGPVGLTRGTVSNANTVPTFTNNLRAQGAIAVEALGVSFRPEAGSDTADANGELTLGGADPAKYAGALAYVPRLTSGAAAAYWGVAIASFSYGATTLATGATGIVDTGTTLIYIPTAAYTKFLAASGGRSDASTGLVVYTTKPTGTFAVKLGATTYTLTPAQYLVPSAQYAEFGLSSGKYYAWINDGGASGVNTIIGQKFLENYYSVYDTTNSRIGFATAV